MCHAKRQLDWCKACDHWTLEKWKRVLWSDESRFTICQSDGLIWVWRMPGEHYLPEMHSGNCKVWFGPLVTVGNLNATP